MQRFVALAVGGSVLYSLTSAGSFRAVHLHLEPQPSTAGDGEITPTPAASTSSAPISIASEQTLDLPCPLAAAAFYPPTAPRYFAYGGQEVPLSLWHLPSALREHGNKAAANGNRASAARASSSSGGSSSAPATSEQEKEPEPLNAKQRKRKRAQEARARAKELLQGEIWRAKNAANDKLELPQKPNVTSLAFAFAPGCGDVSVEPQETVGEEEEDDADGTRLIPKGLRLLVGTREGLLRVFEPGHASGVRRARFEHRIVPKNAGDEASGALAVKELVALPIPPFSEEGSEGGETAGVALAADASKKVYAIEWAKGKVLGQLKGINGSVNTLLALPPPPPATTTAAKGKKEKAAAFSRVISNSQDRLVRLHHLPLWVAAPLDTATKAGSGAVETLARGSIRTPQLLAQGFAGTAMAPTVQLTTAVWDGVRPLTTVEPAGAEGGEDEEEVDEFDALDTVGVDAGSGSEGEDGEEAEEEEESEDEEEGKKRARK